VAKKGFHPLRPIWAMMPMDHLIMDLSCPFKVTDEGYIYVLVVVDMATRYVWLRPLKRKTAADIVAVLFGIFVEFREPNVLQSDNDKSLVNVVAARLSEDLRYEWRKDPVTPILATLNNPSS